MKYFTLFFIATFLLFAAGLHAQCWVLKNVDPNSWEVEDIFFVDSEHGWAAADDGRILKSTDGGNSWQIKQTGIPYDIQSLHFVDTLRGWAIGWDKIIRTVDGGESWAVQSIPLSITHFSSVYFTSATTGWAVGFDVLKTTDGGNTWTVKDPGFTTYDKVQFVDSQHGWILSQYNIAVTTNGGNSWTKYFHYNTFGGNYVNDLHFVTSKIGWAVTDDDIFRTNDGGVTWTLQHHHNALFDGYDSVHFPDTLNGYVAGFDGVILRSTDGGNTWLEELHNGTFWFDVFAINDSVGFVGGPFGKIGKRVGVPQITVTGDQSPLCQYATDTVFFTGHSNEHFSSYKWHLDNNPDVYATSPAVQIPTNLLPGVHSFYAEINNSQYCHAVSPPHTFEIIPQVNAIISGPNSICAGKTATLNAPAGNATYQWSTGAQTQSISVTPNSNTSYTVTVTNVGGCTKTDSHTIFVNANPIATAGPDTALCAGRPVKLTASGGGTYLWNTGNVLSSFTITPSSSTVYSVTVTNQLGCKDTAYVNVQVNPVPEVELGTHAPVCAGETITLTAMAIGAEKYIWNTGDTTTSITATPLQSQQYRVTVTAPGGCTDSDWIFINVQNEADVNAGPDIGFCPGQTVQLTATGSANYLWSDGQSGSSISVSPTQTTTYTVVGSSTGTCAGLDTITLYLLPTASIDAGQDIETCLGQVVQLEVSGASEYQWSNGSTGNVILVSPDTTTVYTVTASAPGYCTATDHVMVTVNLPEQPDPGPDQIVCFGQTVTLSVDEVVGGLIYWSNGQTGISVTLAPTETTIYTVYTISQDGCEASENVLISVVQENEIGHIQIQDGLFTCAAIENLGCTTDFPDALFVWSGPGGFESTLAFPPVNETGNYQVVVTNPANGCTLSASATYVLDTVTTHIQLQQLQHDQNSTGSGSIDISLTGGSQPLDIRWLLNGILFSSEEDISGLHAGEYTCMVTGANGCMTEQIFVIDNLSSVISTFKEVGWTVQPNPAREYVYVALSEPVQTAQLQLRDATGRKVLEKKFDGAGCRVDIGNMKSGLYFVEVQSGKIKAQGKLVVMGQ